MLPHHAHDLIIVGSGAAGLCAALTAVRHGARVVVMEASDLIGGATAYSEGMVWAPNHPAAVALPDAPDPSKEAEDAIAYLRATAGNAFDPGRARAYVEAAAPTLRFLEESAGLSFALNRASRDYDPSAAGATVGRRALNPDPVDGRGLDLVLFDRLRAPPATMTVFGGMQIASRDLSHFLRAARRPESALRVALLIGRHVLDRLSGWPRGTQLANGAGIVAALARAATASGVEIRTATPVDRLLVEEGRVVGVEIAGQAVRATRGVVLSSGGVTSAHASRAELAPWSSHIAIPPSAPGPALSDLISETDAFIDADVSQPLLWAPASIVPEGVSRPGPWPHFSDRAKPGVICVGPDGRRFVNEARVYHDFVPEMVLATGGHPNGPHAYLIADHAALRRYGLGPIGPFPVRLGPYLRTGYLLRGKDPHALAREIGVDPEVLASTIARFNDHAARGSDPLFGRGESAYDRGMGDPEHAPNPTLRPLETPPFYAIRIATGDIGGFVGVRCDEVGRALARGGGTVPGLWVAGNAATPLTGGTYPAAGLTVGAALVFGHLAALDATAPALAEAAS